MANPQLEDGYIRIANEVFQALCRIRIPGEARQVFDAILRLTWGWGKKMDTLALSQISLATGLSRQKVLRARNKLVELNLIFVPQKGYSKHQTYKINKDFATWKPYPKKSTQPKVYPKKGTGVPQKGYKVYPKKGHSKDNKEITPKKERVSVKKQTDPRIKHVFDYFHERHCAETGVKPVLGPKEGNLCRKLLSTYGTVEAVCGLIDRFFDSDDEWILSAGRGFNVFYSQAGKLATARKAQTQDDINNQAKEKARALLREQGFNV